MAPPVPRSRDALRPSGCRNGYRRGRLRTAEGPIEYGLPQVADRTEPFVSRVPAGAGRTAELEQPRRGNERLWQEDDAFAARDLSEFAVAYLVAERLHAGLPREAVLCARGITEDGRKVLLHLAPGTKEDTASYTALFEDLKRRGLADPHVSASDLCSG